MTLATAKSAETIFNEVQRDLTKERQDEYFKQQRNMDKLAYKFPDKLRATKYGKLEHKSKLPKPIARVMLATPKQAAKVTLDTAVKRVSEKAIEAVTGCKPRPKKNTGGGGSRSFIPWCKSTGKRR